jgi:hypothetical protein
VSVTGDALWDVLRPRASGLRDWDPEPGKRGVLINTFRLRPTRTDHKDTTVTIPATGCAYCGAMEHR